MKGCPYPAEPGGELCARHRDLRDGASGNGVPTAYQLGAGQWWRRIARARSATAPGGGTKARPRAPEPTRRHLLTIYSQGLGRRPEPTHPTTGPPRPPRPPRYHYDPVGMVAPAGRKGPTAGQLEHARQFGIDPAGLNRRQLQERIEAAQRKSAPCCCHPDRSVRDGVDSARNGQARNHQQRQLTTPEPQAKPAPPPPPLTARADLEALERAEAHGYLVVAGKADALTDAYRAWCAVHRRPYIRVRQFANSAQVKLDMETAGSKVTTDAWPRIRYAVRQIDRKAWVIQPEGCKSRVYVVRVPLAAADQLAAELVALAAECAQSLGSRLKPPSPGQILHAQALGIQGAESMTPAELQKQIEQRQREGAAR